MVNVRVAKPGEEVLVSDLAVEIFKPNMKEQFIRLFHQNNIEHIFVGVDDDKIVSALNYYPSVIQSYDEQFKVGSIGAVCTKESHRKLGLSSSLLAMAEQKMKEEHIDFCIISGRRGLYQRFGARDVGAIENYTFKPIETSEPCDVRPYQGESKILYNLYQKEQVFYQRTYEEFVDLFNGQTYPDSYQTYPTYIIYDNNTPVAYIIFILHRDKDILEVKEMAGSRKHIYDALSYVLEKHHKNMIDIKITAHDDIKNYLLDEVKKMSQQATLKIIDHVSFLNKLNHMMLNKDVPVSFQINDEHINLIIENQTYPLTHNTLHNLIFSWDHNLKLPSEYDAYIKEVFPLELPWSHNLNYQ
ncbi:MAG TPA: GNAT family N-acetyltransferase [Acholeplasmataceae bacterium]|nr:GNAT family N-acetyltransferase [Acholeplasmataceae bacterium]